MVPESHVHTLKGGRPKEKASASWLMWWHRGSLTVEAAAVLPLFLFGLLTMFSFMDLYGRQSQQLTRLCGEAKQEALVGCTGEALLTEVEDSWEYKPLLLLSVLPGISFQNRVCVRCWNGRGEYADVSREWEEMVYVTASGSVYHTDASCSYLHLGIRAVSGEEALHSVNQGGSAYHACETCSRGETPASVTYITDYGTRYHNDGGCSGLKRSVRLVRESEVTGLHLCSRCAAHGG